MPPFLVALCTAAFLMFFLYFAALAFVQSKPEIRDMTTTTDEHSITATFTVYNKPVNAFWALFQVKWLALHFDS